MLTLTGSTLKWALGTNIDTIHTIGAGHVSSRFWRLLGLELSRVDHDDWMVDQSAAVWR
jgi:hypothetical protein